MSRSSWAVTTSSEHRRHKRKEPDLPTASLTHVNGTRRATRLLLPSAAAGALVLAPAPAALATSCATDPLATPAALTAGTHPDRGKDFFDQYDYALIGTVTDKATGSRGGRTTVTFDVAGVLGRDLADPVIDVMLTDDGQLNGYRFEPGRAYFVPLVDRNANGLTNFSFLCDPIAPVTDPTAEFARLSVLVQARGIATATPVARATDGQEGVVNDEDRELLGWAAVGGLVFLAAAGSVTVAVRRRA